MTFDGLDLLILIATGVFGWLWWRVAERIADKR